MPTELVVTQDFALPIPAEKEGEEPSTKLFAKGAVITESDEMEAAQRVAPHCVVRRAALPKPEPAPEHGG